MRLVFPYPLEVTGVTWTIYLRPEAFKVKNILRRLRTDNISNSCTIPDICHKHHKQCLWRKLLSCGEIFPYDRLSCREVSPHEKCEENLSHRESSPHDFGAKCVYAEKCGEICHVDKCFHMTDISTWEMKNVETICFYALILHNHISLSQLTMYCYNLRCFVAKSVLLQFTRFWLEKIWTKNCACGKKRQISGMEFYNLKFVREKNPSLGTKLNSSGWQESGIPAYLSS